MAKEIQKLSSEKKDFISETFIILAKLDYRIVFLDWFIRTKIDKTTEAGQAKILEVEESVANAKFM